MQTIFRVIGSIIAAAVTLYFLLAVAGIVVAVLAALIVAGVAAVVTGLLFGRVKIRVHRL